MTEPLGAIVLAGGKSLRMGSAKAWLDFDGEALLVRVCRTVATIASPIIVVAAPAQDLPELDPRIRIVRDAIEGDGPLGGLSAGLAALDGVAEAAFVTSTDVPFLAIELARRLAALRDEGDFDAAIPRAFGADHPLTAIYAVRVRRVVDDLLARGVRRARSLGESVNTRFASAELLLEDPLLAAIDPELASLRSVNTPEEYAAARLEAERRRLPSSR
jgi:molybdopterin-guanine dinucleotide biosynthesis protein A